MSDYTYGTMAGSTYSISLSPTVGKEPARTPSGLIVTRAVETKTGWLGQILVDKQIVFQGEPQEDGDSAIKQANAHVVRVIRGLFAGLAEGEENGGNSR